jgi:hypothetical protein
VFTHRAQLFSFPVPMNEPAMFHFSFNLEICVFCVIEFCADQVDVAQEFVECFAVFDLYCKQKAHNHHIDS